MIEMISRPEPRRHEALGILTAVYGRPALSRRCQEYYASIDHPALEIVRVAVRSPEDPNPPPDVDGWTYVEAPNEPLGKKMNIGMDQLRRLGVTAVMIVGDDDWVSMGYLDLVDSQLQRGRDYIRPKDLHVYVPGSGRVAYCESMTPGAGRVVTQTALDHLRWRLWDGDINRYLDSSAHHRLTQLNINRHNARTSEGNRWAIVDVKPTGSTGIWRLRQSSDGRGMSLVGERDAELHIRKVVYQDARRFFREYFPMLDDWETLGVTDAAQ